ncbi:MAG TPA: RNA-guided endonuclease TnpB family protein [Ktedonobacterales bacterium]|nr:RNA-guided endonuclease TnpB family protein [Ktedonobacterales bacterium]
MKQTLLVKLAPTLDQHATLLRTLETFNAACNAIAAVAFAEKVAGKLDLQKLVYYDIRAQFGLSAQMTIRAIAKVSEAYKRDKALQPHFRAHSAMVYDQRICSFPGPDRVSLLTLDGRAVMPFRFGRYAEGMLQRVRGQCDVLYRADSATFFLAITVDAPEPTPDDVSDYLGVDLGIVNIATTSDGEIINHGPKMIHAHVNTVRARYSRFRAKLQQKGTKSAKRLLKKRSGREMRFTRDTNHCISKTLVSTAQDTARGIALEDLRNIRTRVTVRSKRQRRVLHSWGFFQLRAFIAYKAALAGVRVALVNPAYTSQTCSACGHCEKANRKTQSKFLCQSCGYACHADVNAAINIGRRAAVIPPNAAPLVG